MSEGGAATFDGGCQACAYLDAQLVFGLDALGGSPAVDLLAVEEVACAVLVFVVRYEVFAHQVSDVGHGDSEVSGHFCGVHYSLLRGSGGLDELFEHRFDALLALAYLF